MWRRSISLLTVNNLKNIKPYSLTLSISFLSSRLAQNSKIRYTPNIDSTTEKQTGFSDRLVKPANALEKSIGFGATKKPPANVARLTTVRFLGTTAFCDSVDLATRSITKSSLLPI